MLLLVKTYLKPLYASKENTISTLPKIRDLDLTQYFADMQASPQLRPTQPPPAGADIESVMDAGLGPCTLVTVSLCTPGPGPVDFSALLSSQHIHEF